MNSQIFIVFLLSIVCMASCHHTGPYILFGFENFNQFNISALQRMDNSELHKIYQNVSKILIFIKNKEIRLTSKDFPKLSKCIENNEHLYLPQEFLPSDPSQFNENVEIIKLSEFESFQDTQIFDFFYEAQNKYGKGKVLGILANNYQIKRHKRDLTNEFETTTKAPEKSAKIHFDVKDNILFYTYNTPKLIFKNEGGNVHVLEKFKSVEAAYNEDKSIQTLTVNYIIDNKDFSLKFLFGINSGIWKFEYVELDMGNTKEVLKIYENIPSGPIGKYSYGCNKVLVFKNQQNTIHLQLQNVQIQRFLKPDSAMSFGPVIDCIGIVSLGTFYGVFISGFLVFILSIGIGAIMNIRSSDRIENSHTNNLFYYFEE
ncbi:hypothetical protein PVAND_012040 [Polypedilum vanderplanki]|uniref:V-type proton ATPase subunit S1/VOA1 transmembrane domain-containing protein n=1 Tax=Polypedilum vanderplanki TaxID=319348 RepID=A0A9J6CKD9_POLVA|nr:hypothetical protein PVAND_012040 [Polypedilum vanderplanki]